MILKGARSFELNYVTWQHVEIMPVRGASFWSVTMTFTKHDVPFAFYLLSVLINKFLFFVFIG